MNTLPRRILLRLRTHRLIKSQSVSGSIWTYNRYPLVLTRGKGVFLYDIKGKRYLDFVSGLGVNALGHAHPRIVKAIR